VKTKNQEKVDMENKNIFLFCKIAVFSLVLTLLAGFGGCGSNKSKNVVGGMAVGAILGGGIGAAIGSSTTTTAATTAVTTTSNTVAGAAIGAGTGAAIGGAMGAACTDDAPGKTHSTKKAKKSVKNK